MRFAQWLFGVAMIGAAGAGIVWMLDDGDARRLREEHLRLTHERNELLRAVDRLTGEDRVAEVHVLHRIAAGEMFNGSPAPTSITTLEFIELDRDGHPLPSRTFQLLGNKIYFEAFVIKFDHEHVAEGDPLRGKSVTLFNRVFSHYEATPGETVASSTDAPETRVQVDSFQIDPSDDVPNLYRIEPEPNPYELRIWERIWDYASNPKLATEDGVRVVQIEAVRSIIAMDKGQVWALTLQNNGGLNLKLHRGHADANLKRGDAPGGRGSDNN